MRAMLDLEPGSRDVGEAGVAVASVAQNAGPRHGAHRPPWAAVLGRFYERSGLSGPWLKKLEARDVPESYRQLLVHSNDMTPTLEHFYRAPLHLHVLSSERVSNTYAREVVLEIEHTRRPVEYGAICVHLEHFPEPVQAMILAGQQPFGRILQSETIAHLSWPQAFFSGKADGHMRRLMRLADESMLYGRRNVLVDGRRRLLAEVIEILAPVSEPSLPSR